MLIRLLEFHFIVLEIQTFQGHQDQLNWSMGRHSNTHPNLNQENVRITEVSINPDAPFRAVGESHFQYKYHLTSYNKKKKKKKKKKKFAILGVVLGRFSLSLSLYFSPKTHIKTFDSLLFLNNQEVVFLLSPSSPWFQNLGFEVQGCRSSSFATIYAHLGFLVSNMLYSFSQYISYFLLLYLASYHVYCFPSMSTCFITCFMALMLLAQPSCARICPFVSCLFLDLHVYVFFAMFMFRSTCLDVMPSVWLCLCLSCLCLFLVLWLLGRICIQILWSRPISISLGLH